MLCGAGTGSRSSGKKRVWEMRQSRTGTGALLHLPGVGLGAEGDGGIGDFSRWWFSVVDKNLFWGVGTEARLKGPQLGVVDG